MGLTTVFLLLAVMYVVAALPENYPAPEPEARNFLDDKVKAVLEKLKSQMKDGIPESGIPSLDPLTLPPIDLGPLKIGHIAKMNTAKFANTKVNGLPNFSIDSMKTSILALSANLTLHFPLLAIDGDYDIDGMFVNILPIFGKGPFHVIVRDILAGGNAKCQMSGGKMSLKTLQLHVAIDQVDIKLEGLLGGGDLGQEMNGLVQKTGNLLVRNMAPKLAVLFSEFARLKINDALKNIDINDLINGKGK